MKHPELLTQYLDFCRHRECGNKFGRIIFHDGSYPHPTTALPLYELSLKNPKLSFQFATGESADSAKKISFSEISDSHLLLLYLEVNLSQSFSREYLHQIFHNKASMVSQSYLM